MARIVINPTIMSGEWTIKGTPVLAITIAAYIHAGRSEAEIHDDYPSLPTGTVDAVKAWMRGEGRDYDRELIRNSVHCLLCKTDAVSESRHSMKHCRCGNVAADGGKGPGSYARRVYRDDPNTWVDTSIFVGDA